MQSNQISFNKNKSILSLKTFEEAVKWNNEVDQGLSSSLFTTNPEYLFKWIGPNGSDCGIVNLN
jgi:aldehyde dehydrogenase family 7 protein A1